MKCAFVNLGRHNGGAEQYLQTIIKRWVDENNKAVVIVRRGSEFSKNIRKNMPELLAEEVEFDLKSVYKIRKLLKNSDVDIVHINGINSGVFINLVRVNIPTITTVHSNADLDRAERSRIVRGLFVRLENYCLKRSKRIIAVSEVINKLLISRGISEKNITVIDNGVKYIEYPPKLWRNGDIDTLKICYIGRLEKVKGCEYLIRSISLLDQRCDISCDIYGTGSLKNQLVELCKELRVDMKVNFMGYSSCIREYLPEYDVLVMPSLYEASPLTIPEAMNARTLLVCSDVGGITYMIKNGINGLLFECGNYRKLAEILKKIYFNEEDFNKILENAYRDFVNQYTEDVMIEKTFNILKNCK